MASTLVAMAPNLRAMASTAAFQAKCSYVLVHPDVKGAISLIYLSFIDIWNLVSP